MPRTRKRDDGNNMVGPTEVALRHNPGFSLEWSFQEQSVLEQLSHQYGSEPNLIRYAKIAQALEDKTIRDVALRCRWMAQMESSKRRKDDGCSSRKFNKTVANSSNGSPHAQCPISTDDGISYKGLRGAAGQPFRQIAEAFSLIAANFAEPKITENIRLFCMVRDNILKISNEFEVRQLLVSEPCREEVTLSKITTTQYLKEFRSRLHKKDGILYIEGCNSSSYKYLMVYFFASLKLLDEVVK